MLYRKISTRCLAMLVLVAASVPLLSCSHTASKATNTDEFDQWGNREQSISAETRFLGRDGEAALEQAKAQLANGKYRAGIGDLERLVADRTIDPEIREDAMLSVGEAQGSWLNPFKDYQKGINWLEQLLVEYPDTKSRERAEAMIAQYRTELAKQQP
jgi:hypothetical protein